MGFLSSKIKKIENEIELLEMKNSVNFAIVTSDNFLLLASQFRASIRSEIINLFGGYIEEGEDWKKALYRELKEETNISKDDIHGFDILFENKLVSPGYTTERNTTCILFLNKKLDELNLKCNDEKENINIKKFYLSKYTIKELAKETETLKLYLVLKELNKYTLRRG